MLRVRVGSSVADAQQRVPTSQFPHSSRGQRRRRGGCVERREDQGMVGIPFAIRRAGVRPSCFGRTTPWQLRDWGRVAAAPLTKGELLSQLPREVLLQRGFVAVDHAPVNDS